jgi:hypothetical protein
MVDPRLRGKGPALLFSYCLENSDRFGTLSINSAFNWIVYAGGGTNLYVGLATAYEALKDAK